MSPICDYLQMPRVSAKLLLSDLDKIKELAVSKAWWDSVDNLDEVAGVIVKKNPQAKEIMLEWSAADNFWLRRLAIDHQLTFKKATDEHLLAAIIENNLSDSVFAIFLLFVSRETPFIDIYWLLGQINGSFVLDGFQ